MAIQLGDTAPDFTAETTEGKINFHEYLGDGWGVLFSHPKDFTPVCTTELGAVAKLKDEFTKRNAKVIGRQRRPARLPQGVDPRHQRDPGDDGQLPDHRRPRPDGRRPLRDDPPERRDTVTVRSVFIIGPDKKVKLTIIYPQSAGRNFQEILRVLDSLQLSANYSVSTPADWKDGEDVIIMPAVSDEDAKQKFPKGFKALRPYLRLTPSRTSSQRRPGSVPPDVGTGGNGHSARAGGGTSPWRG